MADVVSKAKRSEMMAGIRGRDTKPEMLIRRGLHAMGYRFRVHRRDLPGNPDIVLPKYHAVIFVHGCFWHGHDCHLFKWPKTREEFWQTKICGNVRRDALRCGELKDAGWRVFDVWECSLRRTEHANAALHRLNGLILSDQRSGGVPHNRRVECDLGS